MDPAAGAKESRRQPAVRPVRRARIPIVAALGVIAAAVAVAVFAIVKGLGPGVQETPSVHLFQVHATYNLTGKPELERAIANLPAAIAVRVSQMATSLHGLFVDLPRKESMGTPQATIQLDNRTRTVTGLPIDHYLFEWITPEATDDNQFNQIHVEAAPEGGTRGASGVFIQLIQDNQGTIRVESTLEVTGSGGGRSSQRCWDSAPVEIRDESGASLASAVDAVAACILITFIERRLIAIESSGEPVGAKLRFIQLYKPILDLGDSRRQHALLTGVERYHAYATSWTSQPGDAAMALKRSVDDFHVAAGGDDFEKKSRYPLAEYLYVHAATTQVIGSPETSARRTERAEVSGLSKSDIDLHAGIAFKTWPFSCARWARGVALRAMERHADARNVWQQLEASASSDGSGCATFYDGPKYRALRRSAGGQIVNSYWFSGDFAAALGARCARRRDAAGEGAPATCSCDGTDGPPSTPPVQEERAFGCNGGPGPLPSEPASDPQTSMEAAAANFESAFDYQLLVDVLALPQADVVPVHRGYMQLWEDLLPLRLAAAEIACHTYPKTEEDTSRENLTLHMRALDKNQAKCAEDEGSCASFREEIDAFIFAVIELSSHRIGRTLDTAMQRLAAERHRLCSDGTLSKTRSECMENDARPADASSSGGATVSGSSLSVSSGEVSLGSRDKETLLVQVDDLQARSAAMAVSVECRKLAATVEPAGVLDAVKELSEKHGVLLRWSPHAESMAQALAECAVLLFSAAGEATPADRRSSNRVASTWAFRPPDPDTAFQVERFLRDSLVAGRTEEHAPSVHLTLLRYATLWSALDAYRPSASAEAFEKLFREQRVTVRRAWRRTRRWPDRKRIILELWQAGIEAPRAPIGAPLQQASAADSVKRSLASIGRSAARELWRRRHAIPKVQLQRECAEVAPIAACATSPGDELLEVCGDSLRMSECVFDTAARSFTRWAAAPERSKGTGAARSEDPEEVLQEALHKVQVSREAITAAVRFGLQIVLQGFVRDVRSEHIRESPAVRMLLFRLLGKLRPIAGDMGGLEGVSSHVAQALDFAVRGSPEPGVLSSMASPNIVRDLGGRGIAFEDKNHLAVQSLPMAVRVLNQPRNDPRAGGDLCRAEDLSKQGEPCWGPDAHEQSRWTRRFFEHVVSRPELYASSNVVDRQRTRRHRLEDAYRDWCLWAVAPVQSPNASGEKRAWPGRLEPELSALAWIWQNDFTGKEQERATVLSGDGVVSYFAMRRGGRGAPSRRDDPEAQLAEAQSALKRGEADNALGFALQAQNLFRSSGARALGGDVDLLVAEAWMWNASYARTNAAYRAAVRAYKQTRSVTDKTQVLPRLRAAAALIELGRDDEAMDLLNTHKDCHKAQLLAAVIHWRRHERDIARARTAKSEISFAELNHSMPDPGCSDADGPVLAGDGALMIGRAILRERSSR